MAGTAGSAAAGLGVVPRSFLYVPGDRPDLFDKAAAGPADALVLDLEDAVPAARKQEARSAVTAWLGSAPTGDRPELWARVDPGALDLDLAAITGGALDGILLAKCTTASLEQAAGVLAGLLEHPVPIIGLVESARGLADLAAMAAHPTVTTFGIGETDLLGDLRLTRSATTGGAVDQLRLQVVLACAAAGLPAPVAPTSTAFRDLDAFRETTRHLRDLGFRSRTAIHPGQLAVIHEVLSPTAEEISRAQDVLDRFDAASGGVTTDVDGHLIDAAVVRGARETMLLRDAAARRRTR